MIVMERFRERNTLRDRFGMRALSDSPQAVICGSATTQKYPLLFVTSCNVRCGIDQRLISSDERIRGMRTAGASETSGGKSMRANPLCGIIAFVETTGFDTERI